MFSKKSVVPVIAIGLLLLLAVSAFFVIFTSTKQYSSSISAQVETQGGDVEILGVKNGYLHLKNDFNNLTIRDVEIDGVSCGISGSHSTQTIQVDVYNCINSEIYTVNVITNKKIVTKTLNKEISYKRPTFSSVWDTTLTTLGSSSSNQISLPLTSSGTYDFHVDWGDGTSNTITAYDQSEVTHTYSSPGIYTINITGTIKGFKFAYSGDRAKILEIKEWGPLQLGIGGRYFYAASNLEITATDILNTSDIDDMSLMFRYANSITTIPNIEHWDVSNVESMSSTFSSLSNFNQDLSSWDVSNVRSMANMFWGASSFNQNLSSWNVSNVTNMYRMFSGASNFNQNLSSWDVSSVTNMRNMFDGASNFNGNISSWNVSNVEDIYGMFSSATDFNQDISSWNVSNVTSMNGMFYRASSFNQNINSWDVSNVESMASMFERASNFNYSLNDWDVSKVNNMGHMFYRNSFFNGNISSWNVSSVTTMTNMFDYARDFNQDISNWDVSSVTSMTRMFSHATDFNQDLSCWNVTNIGSKPYRFADDSSLEESNNPVWGTDGTGCVEFLSTWNTTNPGTSSSNQIILPLLSSGTYNFTVDWGDGTDDTITQWNQSEVTHTYSSSGIYNVSITGDIDGWSFNNGGDVQKIIEIREWGLLRLGDSGGYFYGAGNLNITATDILNTSGMTNMSYMFEGANDLTTVPNMNLWDTSSVTTMFHMFRYANDFNQPVNDWNTSSVTNMRDLFMVTNFNQPLDNWDVSNVEDMGWMFVNSPFNQSIGNWDTSSVIDMENMFAGSDFNRNISCWNVTNIESDPSGFTGVDEDNEPIWGTDGTSC